MRKSLILVRHGHRDKALGQEADNGLSAKGKRQAVALSQYLLEKDSQSPLILSSPKLRCVETLYPLARKLKTSVRKSDLLLEQQGGSDDLCRRVEKFLRWWKKKGPAFTVACSHGDWIPLFAEEASGESLDLRKGAFAEFTLRVEKVKLGKVVQSLIE